MFADGVKQEISKNDENIMSENLRETHHEIHHKFHHVLLKLRQCWF